MVSVKKVFELLWVNWIYYDLLVGGNVNCVFITSDSRIFNKYLILLLFDVLANNPLKGACTIIVLEVL